MTTPPKVRFRFDPSSGTTIRVEGGWIIVEADPRHTLATIEHDGRKFPIHLEEGAPSLEEEVTWTRRTQ